jgi:hypothetical protein
MLHELLDQLSTAELLLELGQCEGPAKFVDRYFLCSKACAPPVLNFDHD